MKARRMPNGRTVKPEPGRLRLLLDNQTTPHLLAWLFFTTRLADGDKSIIIKEHEDMGRPLAESFESAYLEACRCWLVAGQGATA